MDNFHSPSDFESLTNELSQGREMTMRLRNLLNVDSSSNDNCNYLLHKILRSYDESLSMLKHNRPAPAPAPAAATMLAAANANQESPRGSLVSDDSDQEVKDHASRKRKTVTKWTQKVTVCPETGIEGQLEDGYNWRKYGQKDILGAKYPRGYYRCSHRHGQGCLATKQVQRSDEDPTTFEITYRRKHTCNAHAYLTNDNNNNNQPISMPGPKNQDPNPFPPNSQQPNSNTKKTSLRVITQDLNPSTFNPFDFSLSSSSNTNNNPEHNNIFSDCDDILGDYSPNKFTSESSNCFFTGNYGGGFNQNLDNLLESELNPVVASVTSTITSTHDGRFQPDSSEFGMNFSFENLSYYP